MISTHCSICGRPLPRHQHNIAGFTACALCRQPRRAALQRLECQPCAYNPLRGLRNAGARI